MNKLEVSRVLEERLGIQFPPVALTRVAEQPSDIPKSKDTVPSACTFWRQAEKEVFFAGSTAHMACPIGAMVMGFELPPEKSRELMALVGDMCAVGYLEEAEVEHIPSFVGTTAGVVYGPLAQFPLDPEVIIVWATSQQAMLLDEAVGVSRWTGESAAILGRPSCAALPASADGKTASLSLGCVGMRTFTEVPDTHSLIAVSAEIAENLVAAVRTTLNANKHMEAAYETMKAAAS